MSTRFNNLAVVVSNKQSSNRQYIPIVGGDKNIVNIAVGGAVEQKIKSKIIEWEVFSKLFVSGKYLTQLTVELNEIFPLPTAIHDPVKLLCILDEIGKRPYGEVMNGVIRSFELHDPVKLSIRRLFVSWKTLIESLLTKSSKHIHLAPKWNNFIKQHGVDTSSEIMFFTFPPKINSNFISSHAQFSSTSNIGQIIVPSDLKIQLKGDPHRICEFQKAASDYKYAGFCPMESVARVLLLLNFPVKELYLINPKKCGRSAEIKKLKNVVTENLHKLTKLKKPGYPKGCPGITDIKDSMENRISHFIKEYIELYKKIKPCLIKWENYFIEIAKLIAEINNAIDTLCTTQV
jgi:hypothetical protein